MSIASKTRTIYLDNAAATPIDPLVKQEMVKAMELYGNPSSFNDMGRLARKKMDESRSTVARFIGARPEEIIFTSSGSESNNTALMGVFFGNFYKDKSRNQIITTPIEHPSVLEPLKILSYEGGETVFLKVDKNGFIDLDELKKSLNSKTLMVSIMYANNEIGTIQSIKKISKIIKDFRRNDKYPLFHVDACQATEYLDMNVNNLGVDLLTFNGSKIYGPRGIGVLYVKSGTAITPYILGGGQEKGLRAGTENLPAVAGLAKAISLIDPPSPKASDGHGKKEGKRVAELRDYFLIQLNKVIPDAKINGPIGDDRLPNNINISIPDLSAENLLLELDKYGIYASSGSACTARSVEPSHVLKAIGVDKKYLDGALRFSLGHQTTKKDIDYVVATLPKIVGELKKRYRK